MDLKYPYESNALPSGFSYAGGTLPVGSQQSGSSQNLGINSSVTTAASKCKTSGNRLKLQAPIQVDFEALR